MSTRTSPTVQQDRTLSDLLESYRHLQSDRQIPDKRKRRAAERMKDVWAKLAKLQDPDGFINHLSEYIQKQYERRHHHSDRPDLTRRGKPLCRCNRPRHVCEAKEGVVPSKIRSQDLEYLETSDSRTLARQYIQEHPGDVVVREAMEDFRQLRAEIYSELSEILVMLRGGNLSGAEDSGGGDSESSDASGGPGGQPGPSATDSSEPSDAPTAAADGGPSDAPSGGPDDDPDGGPGEGSGEDDAESTAADSLRMMADSHTELEMVGGEEQE